MAIAELRDITFRYDRTAPPIFERFSWAAQAGERWAVIGPSGCGKSTLLYLLAGLRQPEMGSVMVEGVAVTRPRARIGLILQSHGLLPWATVWDNVTLGPRIGQFYRHKQPKEGADDKSAPYPLATIPPERSRAWLERLEIAHLAKKYPAQLSGGQRQRVAIARTLVLEPVLLLMDEPFSALDALTRENLQELVVQLSAERALTTLIVTHDVEEAAFLARRILVLRQPPTHEAMIIENPGAGTFGYRATTDFLAVTSQLRAALIQGPPHEATEIL